MIRSRFVFEGSKGEVRIMSTSHCPHCGAPVAASQVDCPACGTRTAGLAGLSAGAAGALAHRDYRAAPLPVGPYDVELGPFEALSATFRMWSRDWARLSLLAAIPFALMLPFAVAAGVYFAVARPSLDAPGTLIALVGAGVVLGLVVMIAFLASFAGSIALVDERERNGDGALGVIQAFLLGLTKIGRLVVASLAIFGVMSVGAAGFGAPIAASIYKESPAIGILALPGFFVLLAGVWLVLRLYPLWTVLVVEDVALGAAFRRSFELTRGRAGTVFLCGFLFGLVLFGLGIGTGILGLVPILGILVQLGFNLITNALSATFAVAIYAGLVNAEQGGQHD
jgi:hypothetical protein